MKIVALLQNQWSRFPVVMAESMARMEKRGLREAAIARFLFAGCKTGLVLQKHLGADLCRRIVWEDSSRMIGTMASSKFAPDREHIRSVLLKHTPAVVLAFGRVAQLALTALHPSVLAGITVLKCPHPVERTGAAIPVMIEIRKTLEA